MRHLGADFDYCEDGESTLAVINMPVYERQEDRWQRVFKTTSKGKEKTRECLRTTQDFPCTCPLPFPRWEKRTNKRNDLVFNSEHTCEQCRSRLECQMLLLQELLVDVTRRLPLIFGVSIRLCSTLEKGLRDPSARHRCTKCMHYRGDGKSVFEVYV